MENFINNPWVIGIGAAVISGLIVLLFGYHVFGIGKQKSKGSKINKSPFIKAGGSIKAGGDIVVGNRETTVNTTLAREIPEIHLHLDARPTKPVTAHIEKRSDTTLVIIFVEIAGVKTEVNRPFTKLLPLENLSFPQSLLESRSENSKIKVIYRTTTGETYEYSQGLVQESRVDDKFNVSLRGNPTIKPVASLSKEQVEIFIEASKDNGKVFRLETNETGDWVRAGGKDFHFDNDSQKTRLYIDALEGLVSLGYVEHKDGQLYLLTSKSADL